ncbi:hypothetical protein BD560DRAFT_314131, partial [Blakeslea trispora]
LPQAPTGVHAIDNAINLLPTSVQEYCDYWPALLTLLWYVECLVKPESTFVEDPEPGKLW